MDSRHSEHNNHILHSTLLWNITSQMCQIIFPMAMLSRQQRNVGRFVFRVSSELAWGQTKLRAQPHAQISSVGSGGQALGA